MNVLVTGGEGFIGANLIKFLTTRREVTNITSLDNLFSSHNERIEHKKIKYYTGSTADIDKYFRKHDFDVVFHFGEYSRIDPSFDDLDEVFDFNMRGSWQVINFCKDKKIPIIYSGSSSKFGHSNNQHLSPYAWTKAKNTEIIKNFSTWYGLEYNILYFHNVYGPGQIMEGKYATVVGIFEKQLLNGQALTVVSPGTQKRDFTHVDDIVSGVWSAFEHAPPNTEYSLGTGKNYSITEIALAFSENIEMLPPKRGERNTSLADIKTTKEVLKWYPKRDIMEYIESIKEKINA